MRALLALEDGRFFEGESFGATGTTVGEICFNTSMTGYQEVLTDPSYRGQIVTMTYPLIGNYGVNSLDQERRSPHARGDEGVLNDGGSFRRRSNSARGRRRRRHWNGLRP